MRKFTTILLILVVIVGLFTYKSNTTFSTEVYLTRLESVSDFPKITAVSEMLDEWEEISDNNESGIIKALQRIWLILKFGVNIVIQVLLYPIRILIWIIEFISIVFFGFDGSGFGVGDVDFGTGGGFPGGGTGGGGSSGL